VKRTIIKPVEVQVYECDGPDCDRQCEDPLRNCEWIYQTDFEVPRDSNEHYDSWFVGRARRYFCSWACVARWATGKAEANG
jgi:hypothetical protein